jgi:hypothetical protein
METLFPPLPGFADYQATVRGITRDANEVLFRVVNDVLQEYRDGAPHRWTPLKVKEACLDLQQKLLSSRDLFRRRQPGNSKCARFRTIRRDNSPAPEFDWRPPTEC